MSRPDSAQTAAPHCPTPPRRRGPVWSDDGTAALIVSILLIPQSLAYAMLAGLPPEVGLYASLLPLVAYALLGSSPHLAVGPVAVVALMTAQTLARQPLGAPVGMTAAVLALEIGALLALAALLRLDALAALLSVPVLQGFETGATLAIMLTQLPVALGWLSSDATGWAWLTHSSEVWSRASGAAAALGLGAWALLWGARRGLQGWLAKLAPLGVLALALAVVWAWPSTFASVHRVGELPPVHLSLSWPDATWQLAGQLLPDALLISLMVYISSLVVAESLARRDHLRIDPRRELMGLAAANVASGLSLGMPVAGSFSRSALMHDAGARTRWAGAGVAICMGLAAWMLSPVLAQLPRSVLAATILVAVGAGLQFTPYRDAWRYARGEALLMLAVTVTAVVVSTTAALGLGVVGSIALLLQRTAKPHVARIGRVPGTEHYRNVERHQVEQREDVLGLRIDESLVFTNVRSLVDVVQAQIAPTTRRVVLMMSPVNSIDVSGLDALHDLHDTLARQGIQLDLSEVKGPVLDRLQQVDWLRWFRGQVYLTHHQAVQAGLPHDETWHSP